MKKTDEKTQIGEIDEIVDGNVRSNYPVVNRDKNKETISVKNTFGVDRLPIKIIATDRELNLKKLPYPVAILNLSPSNRKLGR